MDRVAKRFERLEQARARTESWVEARLERFHDKPDDRTWSVCQVIAHLTASEGGSLRYVNHKLSDVSSVRKAGLGASVRSAMLAMALRSPFRFRAPQVVSSPSNEPEWADLKAEWKEIRDGWRTLIDQYPAELKGMAIYRHPVAGRLTIAQAVGFLQDHLAHHRRQMNRIEEALLAGSPSTAP